MSPNPDLQSRAAASPPSDGKIRREELEDLYVHQELTIREVAARLGCSPRHAWRLLQDAGIPRRTSGARAATLDPSTLAELYVHRGLSMDAVARELGVSRGVVERNLRAQHLHRDRRPRLPRQLLEDLYVRQHLSAEAVAERVGVSKTVVLADLRYWNVPRRGPGGRRTLTRETLEDIYRDLVDILETPGDPPTG